MKISRFSANCEITWEINFSRELKFYDLEVPTVERGICVPVVPWSYDRNHRDEIYFWDSYEDIKVTVGDDSYILDKDNPKEYARLVNNLEAIFALHGLE